MREVLPSSLEAERAILGILLMGEEEDWDEVAAFLKEEDFFQPAHRTIFAHIQELYKKGQSADPVTVANSLKKQESLDQVGGASYLSDLIHQLASKTNIKAYAKITKEKSTLRKIIQKSESFIQKSYKEDYSKIEHFIDYLESEIFKIGDSKEGSELVPLNQLVEGGLKKLENLYKKKISLTGLSSSFPALDNLTSGFQASELIILAARPSMGKTALSLNIALHNALQNKKVAFFSLEMSKEALLMRLLASLSKIHLSKIMRGQIEEGRWSELIAAAARLSDTQFYIDDSSPLSPYEIRSKSRRLKARQGLDLIVVDYLQLMHLPETRKENREREVSEISRLLKSFAKELEIPILALSQLNRALELRKERRPILSDLRESGAIEQDADLIMMLYRPDYYKDEGSGYDSLAEVIVNKQRNGPTGTIELKWHPEFGSFENYTPALEDNPPISESTTPF